MVVGARQRIQLFRQIAWFLGNNRALPKFRNQILRYVISIIKSLKNLLWVEKISGLLKQKVAGKKFWATFYFYLFWVRILLLKVLLYLSIIFWKIRIDTLYEENGSRKIPPEGIPIRKTPIHQSPPWKPSPIKLLPRKFLPGIFPLISLFVFLHLTLRFDKFSQTWRLWHFGNIELQNSLLSNINVIAIVIAILKKKIENSGGNI